MTKNEKDYVDEEEILNQSPKFTKILTFVLVPLLLVFILFLGPLFTTDANAQEKILFAEKWIYICLVVGILWIVHVVSPSLIAFIPLVSIPLLGIVDAKRLAEEFMSNSNMATFGILVLMMTIDHSGLRRRLTLLILRHTSGSILWLYIYVFLLTTWLSMWISSMGATFLMMKIVDDIIEILKGEVENGATGEERVVILQKILDIQYSKYNSKSQKSSVGGLGEPVENKDASEKTSEIKAVVLEPSKVASYSYNVDEELELFDKETLELFNKFGGELLYAIAVAANIGGTLWPHVSTIGIEMSKRSFTHVFRNVSLNETVIASAPIMFKWTQASWMIYSLPLLLINSIVALKFLLWANFSSSSSARCIVGSTEKKRLCNMTQDKSSLAKMKAVFARKMDELDPWTFHERSILVLIILLVVLCLTRNPLFIRGWSDVLRNGKSTPSSIIVNNATISVIKIKYIEIGDSVPYILIAFMLFLLPKFGCKIFAGPKSSVDTINRSALIGWKTLQTKLPWSIPLLVGASRLVGKFAQTTITDQIATKIMPWTSQNDILFIKLILMGQIIICSTLISNTGAAIVALNFWLKFSGNWNLPMIPISSVASLCFIIPTSSIPTAMVYRYKEKKILSIGYFLRLGIPLFLCTLAITVGYALLWAPATFILR